ncbi:MAG: aldehyde ferredoxin oxidoreductase family protein [Candidatus Jordarchaeales archaeon]
MGRFLEVDLSEGKLSDRTLKENVLRMFLGGKGLALYFLMEQANSLANKGVNLANLDPFSPDNMLVFATGPATGTGFPSSGRYHVMALKSPLTGSVASANSGGEWGPYLKFAGYDGVIVKGAAEKPMYLSIIDGKAELEDASHLWGMNTFDTTSSLKEVYGKDVSVACIGPAGENLVRFANIINDEHRAAGRTGVGAVMGSKRLKAIVVGGGREVALAKPEDFKRKQKEALKKVKENSITGQGLPAYGTAILVNIINAHGIFPTRNFQASVFPEAEKISGETLAEKYLTKRRACWGCPIGCGRVTRVPSGPFAVEYTEGPEYESVWALGADCGVSDLEAIIKANHLCDELGLDTISMGATIACAMELVQRKKIKPERLQGLKLEFGNAAAMVEAVWRTAYKVGIGAELAEGSKRLAEKYGAPELSMSVKGLELPAYDPRGVQGMTLNYATANRGGCHVSGYAIASEVLAPQPVDRFTTEGKAQLVKTLQDFTCVVNSACVCLFVTFALGPSDFASLLSAITGWDLTEDELIKTGERIYNVERRLMNMLGIDGKDDTLPPRLLNEKIREGPAKGHVSKLADMLPEYYELRGWEKGVPKEEKLKELGLST